MAGQAYPGAGDRPRTRSAGELIGWTALADSGALRPRLDGRQFTLATVAAAHDLVENGTADGKVVIDL